MLAVTHAMKAGQDAGDANRVANLATYMKALSIDTFYGSISFATDGSIAGKPMYTVQKQAEV